MIAVHGVARKQFVLVQALILQRVKVRSRVKQGVRTRDLNARLDKRSRCLHQHIAIYISLYYRPLTTNRCFVQIVYLPILFCTISSPLSLSLTLARGSIKNQSELRSFSIFSPFPPIVILFFDNEEKGRSFSSSKLLPIKINFFFFFSRCFSCS